jgi:cell division protein FtsQ
MESIHIVQDVWNQKSRSEKIVNLLLKIAIAVLCTIAFIEVVFQFVIAPRLKINDIIVENDLGLSEDEMLVWAGIKRTDSYLSLNQDEIVKQLLKNPLIREAKVEKIFPNTLKLIARKRTPIAITFIEDHGISIPAYIDREGVVFHIGKLKEEYDLPVISGLDLKGYGIGMRLPETFKNFLSELSGLKETSGTLYNFISEIKLIPTAEHDFELLLYMIPYTTKIRFGSGIDSNSLTYAMMVLDVLKRQGAGKTINEIDFRSKEIVYRKFQGGQDY